MYILALDSTAQVATVALCHDTDLLASFTLQNGNKHSETLLPMIESILQQFHLSPHALQLLACSSGPGSFTGVRIGVSTVKGLAFGTGIPCIGVSTLEALAYNLIGFEGILCPVMNARRGQVYNALFRASGGSMTRMTPDRAISLEELNQEISAYPDAIWLSGDGYSLVREKLRSPHLKETPVVLRAQSGYSVARIAYHQFLANPTADWRDITLAPVYLRPCQAERERLERMDSSLPPVVN